MDFINSYIAFTPLQYPVEATHEGLSRADRLEFVQQRPAEAISVLEQLVTSQEPAIQAAARLRLGRISNRSGNVTRALDEYARLAEGVRAQAERGCCLGGGVGGVGSHLLRLRPGRREAGEEARGLLRRLLSAEQEDCPQ